MTSVLFLPESYYQVNLWHLSSTDTAFPTDFPSLHKTHTLGAETSDI